MSAEDKVSGQLGIVLFLDEKTNEQAAALSIREGNRIELGSRHAPHITLYHSKLTEVPVHSAQECLNDILRLFPLTLEFTNVSAFGGKFLFWDTVRSGNLMRAHDLALGLSKYFIREGIQQADREKIELSQQERLNVEMYGHPLVGDLWRPHVTLGYYPNGIFQVDHPELFTGEARGLAFVRVGEAGTIADIVVQNHI